MLVFSRILLLFLVSRFLSLFLWSNLSYSRTSDWCVHGKSRSLYVRTEDLSISSFSHIEDVFGVIYFWFHYAFGDSYFEDQRINRREFHFIFPWISSTEYHFVISRFSFLSKKSRSIWLFVGICLPSQNMLMYIIFGNHFVNPRILDTEFLSNLISTLMLLLMSYVLISLLIVSRRTVTYHFLHHLADAWGEMSRCRTKSVQNGA